MSSSPASPQDLAPRPTLDSTLGAVLIGLVVASLLFGISNLQVYIYYKKYPNDWTIYRVSVAFLWIMDSLNLALVIHFVYHYLVSIFGDYPGLNEIVWSFKLRIVTNVTIVAAVHSLYCVRLWKLNHRKTLLPRLMPVVVFAGAGVGLVLIVETYKLHFFSDVLNCQWVIYSSYASSVVVDFAVAGTMCYYLNGTRSNFAATNSKIFALILWTLSTGLITSVCSLAALIMYAALPTTFVFMAFEFLLTKLYVNSLLAMLNDRKAIDRGTSEVSFSVNLSQPRCQLEPSSPRSPLPYYSESKVNNLSQPNL